MNDKFYADLNLIQQDEQQLAAYKSNDNTVVVAGPGSGKTRVLTLKAIQLIQSEIAPPSGLACISYSRETVRELKKRLREYGYKPSSRDFIGTIHGFCLLHILQPFAHLFPQYGISSPIAIASDESTWEIYNAVLSELNISSTELSKTSLNRQRSLSLKGASDVQIQTHAFEVEAAKRYEEKLLASGSVDFMSMVNIAAQMIREQDYVKKVVEAKFPWLLIDEYQDLGKTLHETVLELWAQTEIKIFAVGDMNQSIYGFAGAYPDFLKELNNFQDFKSIELTSNYRSNQDIIEGSLDTLAVKPPRPPYSAKKRTNESAEFTFLTCKAEMQSQYEVVATKVIPKLIAKGISYSEIGIIAGQSTEVINMARVLKDSKIPFYIVKWDFENSDVVFWLQECAQWCISPESQSFDELFRFWQNLHEMHSKKLENSEAIFLKSDFHSTLSKSRFKKGTIEWLNSIIDSLQLKELLENSLRYPDENKNLDKLVQEASTKNLSNSSLNRFAFLGESENEVTVTTRHSAKGLEFEAVVLLGMEEGRFPYYKIVEGSREMEEAQRLCYVCVSRAKHECILIRSLVQTISTVRGPWSKPYKESRFWTKLAQRFGNSTNTLSAEKY